MSEMPQMPQMNNGAPESAPAPSQELGVPSHDVEREPVQSEFSEEKESEPVIGEEPVVLANPDNQVHNRATIPLAPKSGIEVIATRAGFIGQRRRKVGDRFKVYKFEQLGLWMRCLDPEMEKRRVKFFEEKKLGKKAKA